eukprot:g3953.t1
MQCQACRSTNVLSIEPIYKSNGSNESSVSAAFEKTFTEKITENLELVERFELEYTLVGSLTSTYHAIIDPSVNMSILQEFLDPDFKSNGIRRKHVHSHCNVLNGYGGRMCAKCIQGYTKSGFDTGCFPCDPDWLVWLKVIGLTTLASLVIFIFVFIIMQGAGSDKKTGAVQKIMLNFLQMLGIVGSMPLKWPQILKQNMALMGSTTMVGESIFPIDCLLPHGVSDVVVKQIMLSLLPVIALGTNVLFWAGKKWWRKQMHKKQGIAELHQMDVPKIIARRHQERMKGLRAEIKSVYAQTKLDKGKNMDLGSLVLGQIEFMEFCHEKHIDLHALWRTYDQDGSGDITTAQFETICRGFGFDWSRDEFNHLLMLFDGANADGYVDLATLIQFSRNFLEKFTLASVTICILLYPTLVTSFFRMIACERDFFDGEHRDDLYLVADLNIKCFHGLHLDYLCSVGIPTGLLYVIGMPLSMFLLMRHAMNHTETQHHDSVQFRFGILMAGYTEKHYAWEIIVTIRKAVMSLIATFGIILGADGQLYFAVLAMGFFICLHAANKPYHDKSLNNLELGNLVIIFISLYTGTLFLLEKIKVEDMMVVAICLGLNPFRISSELSECVREKLHGIDPRELAQSSAVCGDLLIYLVSMIGISLEHHQDTKARNKDTKKMNEESDIGDKTTTQVIELSETNSMNAESTAETAETVGSDEVAKLAEIDDQMKKKAAKWWDQEDGESNTMSPALEFGEDTKGREIGEGREKSGELGNVKTVEPQPQEEDTQVPGRENDTLEKDSESQILDDGSSNHIDDTSIGIENASQADENLEPSTPSQPDTSLLDGALDEVEDQPQDLPKRHTSVIL